MVTMTIDFIYKSFQLSDGSVLNSLIYDTSGAERYRSINELYYRKADAIILVYDISNSFRSFDDIKDYYCKKIKDLCKEDIPVILLGNKTDREEYRKVKTEEGAELAHSYNYIFMETSCLKNENVYEAFETLIELWYSEYQKKQSFKPENNIKDISKKYEIIKNKTTANNAKNSKNANNISPKVDFSAPRIKKTTYLYKLNKYYNY